MGGPFLDEEDPEENPLKDFGRAGGGIPVPPERKVGSNGRKPTRRPFNEPTFYAQEDTHPMLSFNMSPQERQLQNSNNVLQQVQAYIAKENDSRVSQVREMRRMEHEKELARMRMQMEREKTEAMIRRLEQERDPLPPGVISRTRIDGKGRRTRIDATGRVTHG